jgi:hypothetical protein
MLYKTKVITFSLFIIWIITLILIIPNINRIGTYGYYFQQGDNQYYLIDINNGNTNFISEFKDSFFFGSTYFEMNNSGYIGIIERILHENNNSIEINFIYFNLETVNDIVKNNIAYIEDSTEDFLLVLGLSSRVNSNSSSPIFSTIWKEGRLFDGRSESIIEFDISGEIYNKIPFRSDEPYVSMKDIHSLDTGSYLTIISQERNEASSASGNFLTLINGTGHIMNMDELDTNTRSFATNPELTILYSVSTDVSEIKVYEKSQSEINQVNTIDLAFNPSEISYIDESTLLVKHYVNPIKKFVFSLIPVMIFIGIPLYGLIYLRKRSGVKIDIFLYRDR